MPSGCGNTATPTPRAHRLSPDTVKGYGAMGGAGQKTGHLDAKTRELIAIAVSVNASAAVVYSTCTSLKFAVMDLFDGTVAMRWNDLAAAFARYANPVLTRLGRQPEAVRA